MKTRTICRLTAFLLMLSALLTAVGCSTASGGDVIGLMYHDLTEDPAAVTAWTTTPAALRDNLMELTQMGYYPLSLEAYIAGDYEPTRNYFILTFDDGYESNLTLALPILRELYIPASIFVVTDLVGRPDYMNWEQIQAAQESGIFTVYTHTHTHINAQENAAEDFRADVRQSQEELTAHLGDADYRILCYPYGAATQETSRALRAEGYDLVVLQERPKWYSEELDPRLLLRVNVPGRKSDITVLINRHRKHTGLAPLRSDT